MIIPGIGDPVQLMKRAAAQGWVHFPVESVAEPGKDKLRFNMLRSSLKYNGPRPGELLLKDWLKMESARLGIAYRAMEIRFNRGKVKNITVRRVNRRVIWVTPKC